MTGYIVALVFAVLLTVVIGSFNIIAGAIVGFLAVWKVGGAIMVDLFGEAKASMIEWIVFLIPILFILFFFVIPFVIQLIRTRNDPVDPEVLRKANFRPKVKFLTKEELFNGTGSDYPKALYKDWKEFIRGSKVIVSYRASEEEYIDGKVYTAILNRNRSRAEWLLEHLVNYCMTPNPQFPRIEEFDRINLGMNLVDYDGPQPPMYLRSTYKPDAIREMIDRERYRFEKKRDGTVQDLDKFVERMRGFHRVWLVAKTYHVQEYKKDFPTEDDFSDTIKIFYRHTTPELQEYIESNTFEI